MSPIFSGRADKRLPNDPTRDANGDWYHHDTLPARTEELWLDIEHVMRDQIAQYGFFDLESRLGKVRFQRAVSRMVKHARRQHDGYCD
jgi:hypothetical protein